MNERRNRIAPEDRFIAEPDAAPEDLSVAQAAQQIDRLLFGDPEDQPEPRAAISSDEIDGQSAPQSDPRAVLLAEFADVLGETELPVAELLTRLASLARDEPARFDRFHTLAADHGRNAASRQTAPNDVAPDHAARLAELVPEWAEAGQASRGMDEVREFLRGHGVPDSYTTTMSDPREFAIARKAMLFDRAMADRGGLASKRMPPNARVLAPGAASERNASDPTLGGLQARLKRSGRVEDAAAVIERMLFR